MSKKSLIAFLCAGSFIVGIGLTLLVEKSIRARPPASPANGISVSKGPWGTLDELEIPLGDSADLFIDRPTRIQPTRWFFENYSKEQLESLLRGCNLTEQQWALLQQTNAVTIGADGVLLRPPDELVWTLNPTGRARLYEELARFGANYSQQSPFRFTAERLQDRLVTSGLSPAQQARLQTLIYTNDGYQCFADLQLLPAILTTNEFNRVSEALYRVPAFRLRLRVYEDSNVDDLVKYWGQQGREKFIRPLLESLAKVPDRTNGTSINISSLMPPTARLRLYTYPDAWPDADAERQDCFWTALNFFRNPPDPRFLVSQNNKKVLETEYQRISSQPTYGDVVLLLDKHGNSLHACVYLADDFVFTKNGVNRLQPWVIMKMSDMLAYFANQKPNAIAIYRQKDPAKLPDATSKVPLNAAHAGEGLLNR